MDYSVVIATRNRPEVLFQSIPILIAQDPPPKLVAIIDSSDSFQPVWNAPNGASGSKVEMIHNSAPPGLCRQRNLGLQLVNTEVVFFLDDDSILHPGFASAILKVYSFDPSGISAVGGTEVHQPPLLFATGLADIPKDEGYTSRQSITSKSAGWRDRLAPDPIKLIANEHIKRISTRALPPDAKPVETITGFRMTFRTEVVRRFGFEEAFTRYAPFEDRDASLQAWRHGTVLAARNAWVYHHRQPGKRERGFVLGASQILNLAYVVCKNTVPTSPIRKTLYRHIAMKLATTALFAFRRYDRHRTLGQMFALRKLPGFLNLEGEPLRSAYTRIADEINRSSSK
ncbi:MAG: glycosyltransferase [Opitutaceae bacterium]|nr:glycosyltransferase [Opitutaceae bacterium]